MVSLIKIIHLTLTSNKLSPLSDTYPQQLPEIVLSPQLRDLGLCDHIQSAIQNQSGSPVLFDILTATKEWIEGHPFSISSAPVPAARTSLPKSSAPVCRFFAKGSCKFGSKCKNYHPGSCQPDHPPQQLSTETAQQQAPTRNNDTQQLPSSQDTAVATKSPAPDKEGSKKGSMRTAADVISRVRWDPDLPTEKFTIGYLDRFVGIIEKPFSAFSWEDLATVAPNVLAVPEHRIQYFKYLDEIVWDKAKQFDNVFGSRGGKLIQDVILAHSETNSKDSKPNTTSEDSDTGPSIKYKTQERPTHFICFRIRDREITAQAEKVQSHILAGIPDLSEGCALVTALHVTVCMVQLKTQRHEEIAREVMEKTKHFLSQCVPKCTDIVLRGVDNFQDRLVYGKVEPNKALDRLSYLLIERLQDAGLKTPGNYDVYTPHMTLVKMSRPLQRTINTKVIRRELYSGFNGTYFGKQPIEGICLCSMTDPKQDDGFFLRLHDVSNSVLHLSTLIPTLFIKLAAILRDSGIELAGELEFGSHDVTKFDNSVETIGKLVKENVGKDSFRNSLKTKVVILRGLPGSGKSYLASHCGVTDAVVCSSDNYFNKTGTYQFDRKRIVEAHAHCCQQFVQAISDARELVFIDNTNSMRWEYRVYTHLCQLLGLGCQVVEIPHPNLNIVSSYLSRNVHNLTLSAVKDYTDRWEADKTAVPVPPAIAYPKSTSQPAESNGSASPPSVLDICASHFGRLPQRVLESSEPLELFFTGVFLTTATQWELVAAVAPTHSKVYAEHVTLVYQPEFEVLKTLKIGKKVQVTVWGAGDDGEVQAVEVDLPKGITSLNEHPHVTISTVPSSAPKYSNNMLSHHPAKQLQTHLHLDGIVGVAVKESRDGADDHFPILSKSYFLKKVAPRLQRSSEAKTVAAAIAAVDESISITTGTHPVIQLFVFDFDGTLFDSPYPEPGKSAYKTATGREWPYKGWWGTAESLLPPVAVGPGPALAAFHAHHDRTGAATVVLTARNENTASGVHHVLGSYGVRPDVILLKPVNSYYHSASEFKVDYLQQLLEKFPAVKVVRLWDDNEDNLEAYRKFARDNSSSSRGICFEIINAFQMDSAGDMLSSSMELIPFLTRCGVLSTNDYFSAASMGVRFIAEQFGQVIDFDGDVSTLTRIFGSYCFGRRSDVDMLLLAPPTFSPVECMEKLFARLEACGVLYLHKGYSSRCPRLKVKMNFLAHSTIEYDVIFAMLNSEEALKSCAASTSTASLEKLLKRDDQVSKRAFLGLVFLQKVKDIINGTVSSDSFGAVVEMVVQILKANRLKGNCYRCIHTFHIVQLLADFIKTFKKRSSGTNKEMSTDALLREFLSHSALLPASKWEKLCGEFAAKEHIPRLIETFQRVSRSLQGLEGDSLSYEELLMRPTFPPEGYTPVRIECSSSNKQLQWEIENALEARLPTYISQLFSNSLQVIPEGHAISNGTCFAVSKSDSSASIVQDTFRKFWNEFSDYRKKQDVHMELKFESTGMEGLDSDDKTVKEVLKFASSDLQICHMPSSLSANERRIAHETAEKLGIGHRAEGEGKDRHIYLFKRAQ